MGKEYIPEGIPVVGRQPPVVCRLAVMFVCQFCQLCRCLAQLARGKHDLGCNLLGITKGIILFIGRGAGFDGRTIKLMGSLSTADEADNINCNQ